MNLSRRGFIGGIAAASAPFFVGGCKSGSLPPRRISPNAKVNVAIIGCGLIAKSTNVPGFLKDPRCRVTIACDIVKMAPNYFYGKRGGNFGAEGLTNKDGSVRRDVCGSTVIKNMVDKFYGDKACREVF
ncbi:MAG: hypothetical protein J6N18_12150, partial [Kiritimatiellae bacterium]|nr:hypothetical protein [Kiritimatiellia bacterium]